MHLAKPIVTILATASLVLASGCSQTTDDNAGAETAADMADGAAEAAMEADDGSTSRPAVPAAIEAASDSEAPGLSTGAAPGVAFAYRYAFSLPDKAISSVQQEHAAACEELGPQHCQVTGMTYTQSEGGNISADLALMVDPAIAHRFGKEAVDIVNRADGELSDANVTGDNVGGEIEASQLRSAGLERELARIEQRLATPGLTTGEERSLRSRADALRQQLGSEADSRGANERRLATTPMNFSYASKGLFAASNDPLGNAAKTSWSSMENMLAALLTLLGIALPWLLLAGLIALAVRGLRKRPAASVNPSDTPQP
jgi:hypothetical protein